MYIPRDINTFGTHLAVSGWLSMAMLGSRKRITQHHAINRPLRHASQRCRLLLEDGSCSPVESLRTYIYKGVACRTCTSRYLIYNKA